MYNPPFTGNTELDAFLFDIKNSIEEETESISNSVDIDNGTGIISTPEGGVIGYLYRYLSVKYADDTIGTNLSNSPVNKNYFGVYNSDSSVESINPADYTWYLVDGSFSTNKLLWVLNQGGRQVTFSVSQNVPDSNTNWFITPNRSIDLDQPIREYEQYMFIRYATDTVGTGFSTSPINALFYGINTSADEIASTNYLDYEWTPATFSTNKEVYYRSFGGRNIDIKISETKPSGYILYKDSSVINLDTNTLSAVNNLSIISDDPLILESPFRYLLLRYANDGIGTGITTNPSGKAYFGLQASSILTVDNNPSNYIWFDTNSTLITSSNLWTRVSGSTVDFIVSVDAPDNSGWHNSLIQVNEFEPYIDVYSRSGTVVSSITSPTDGRLYNAVTNASGLTTLSLAPFGQGNASNGYVIDPSSTASISIDQFGRVIQSGPIDEIRFSSTLTTATAGQTVFSFTNNQPNQIMVFKNGIFLYPTRDYTRTNLSVTLNTACSVNDTISLYYIRLIDATTSSDKVPFTVQTTTLAYNQTVIPTSFIDGTELLFLNGVLLVDSEYSYTGTNQGYTLNNPSAGGTLDIITFSILNSNTLIFGENYTESIAGVSNIVFPTSFYRNSSLIWFNGVLLKPSSDYTIPGAGDLSSTYTLIGGTSLNGQPSQFCNFKSAGPASVGSVGAMAVAGFDLPIVIDKKPTMLSMFQEMQSQINDLKEQLFYLRNSNDSSN